MRRVRRLVARAQRLVERPADAPTGVSLYSDANARRFEHWVWVSDTTDTPRPLVLALPGIVDATGFTLWQKGRLKEIAANLVKSGAVPPFALVMGCDTGIEQGSGYTDWADGSTLAETHLVHELLPWADANLPLSGRRHIMGVSMGGYGATMLALRHPRLFESVSAISSYFHPEGLIENEKQRDVSERIWGTGAAGQAARDAVDARLLVRNVAAADRPRIAVECGTQDSLIGNSRSFHALLDELKIPHGYAEHPGAHDWDYWRTRFADHLVFHLTGGGPLGTPRSKSQRSHHAPGLTSAPPASMAATASRSHARAASMRTADRSTGTTTAGVPSDWRYTKLARSVSGRSPHASTAATA